MFDSANKADLSIQDKVGTGELVFGYRDMTYTQIPESLASAEYIRTAADSKAFKTAQAHFTAGANCVVSIIIDDRVGTIPQWLSDYEKTGKTAVNSSGVTFDIYIREFS